jgi:hypothetical protein
MRQHSLISGICTGIVLVFITCKAPATHSMIGDNAFTVVGIAKNAKDGPVVVTEDNRVYYVELLTSSGINTWYPPFADKLVEVKGELVEETYPESDKNERSEYVATGSGSRMVIKLATWKLIQK